MGGAISGAINDLTPCPVASHGSVELLRRPR